jgi:hypothetical protein
VAQTLDQKRDERTERAQMITALEFLKPPRLSVTSPGSTSVMRSWMKRSSRKLGAHANTLVLLGVTSE